MHTKFGVPAPSKLAHHIECAVHTIFGVHSTLKLVCTTHHIGVHNTPYWCAMHSIFGVHSTLVHYTIMLYSAQSLVYVIHNRIHKICSSIYCLSSPHAVTAAIQGYHFICIPEIKILVTTTSQKIILCTINALSFQSRLCRAYTLYIK